MRIAIIGTGVAGLVTAHLLQDRHDITVFEARDRIGGHVNTIAIEERSGRLRAVDTGFIVYNETNYPLFTKLMSDLGVATQPSNMSFGVRSDAARLEYSSASLTTLFAQRRNLFSPGYIRMLRDILRFNRDAAPAILNGAAALTLGEYIETTDLSPRLAEHYLMPMGSALWSIPGGRVLEMPAEFFVRFFEKALFVGCGAGKGTSHVTEKLAFKQSLGQCRAVYRNERAVLALAFIVDSFGDEFFARSAFACDEDCTVYFRHPFDEVIKTAHRGAAPD